MTNFPFSYFSFNSFFFHIYIKKKVPGFKEYITGGHKLIDFDYVRRCLKKNQPITLILQLREDGNIGRRERL